MDLINTSSSEVPIIPLNEPDRLWLQAIYDTARQNKRPSYPQLRTRTDKDIPQNYDPQNIDRNLIMWNNEEITLAGIVALEKDRLILDKANRILRALREILKKDYSVKSLEAGQIAMEAGLPENEVHILLVLLSWNIRCFSGGGTRKQDFYGMEFISLDDAAIKTIFEFEDISREICKSMKNDEVSHDDEQRQNDQSSIPKPTMATQVLAIHFLLKEFGVNGPDNSAAVSRFIQFLTGRELNSKRIQDSSIYKKVQKPFRVNDKYLLKELQTILPYYKEMGLNKIVYEIEREIKNSEQSG